MRRPFLWIMPVLLVLTVWPLFSAAGPEDKEGFVPLFDGKTLKGWTRAGGQATYAVEDGCVVGEVGPGRNSFLCTEKTFRDFILKLELKLDVPFNSGIQFRSHKRPDGVVFGYQCEVDPSERAWSGGIYDESRRGWLYSLENKEAARKAFKRDDWNEFVIQAIGPSIKTWVNGVACADLADDADAEGFIALQVHSAKEGRIRWRNIRLKEAKAGAEAQPTTGQVVSRWAPQIAAFEAEDRSSPPLPGGIVFLGSSSIRLWNLGEWFPGLPAVNRGFGGSQIEDSTAFVDRIITPRRPSAIVFYAGDNDIASGKSPERVAADFKEFVAQVRNSLPEARILFISIKPSLKRWALIEKVRAANALIRAETEKDARVSFVDVDRPMIGMDGRPRPELFVADGLHLSTQGYRLWTSLIRPLLGP